MWILDRVIHVHMDSYSLSNVYILPCVAARESINFDKEYESTYLITNNMIVVPAEFIEMSIF
jgi:hypothetical protein